jgi:hypothetical protein
LKDPDVVDVFAEPEAMKTPETVFCTTVATSSSTA